jgi:hypothetical protein
MIERKGRVHRSIGGGVLIGVAVASAAAGSGELPPISVTCSAAPGIDAGRATDLCDGFLSALPVAYPDRSFVVDGTAAPAMEVFVIRASDAEVGLGLVWHLPDGSKTPGKPFQISMMDRKITSSNLSGLYHSFLGHNPLPF